MPWHYSLQCPGVWQWELLLQGLQHPPSKISHFSKSSPNCARYNITLDMTNCATLASSVQATIRYDRLRYVAHDNDSSRCCEQQCGLINAPVQSKKEIFLSLFLAAVFRWPCMLWSLTLGKCFRLLRTLTHSQSIKGALRDSSVAKIHLWAF